MCSGRVRIGMRCSGAADRAGSALKLGFCGWLHARRRDFGGSRRRGVADTPERGSVFWHVSVTRACGCRSGTNLFSRIRSRCDLIISSGSKLTLLTIPPAPKGRSANAQTTADATGRVFEACRVPSIAAPIRPRAERGEHLCPAILGFTAVGRVIRRADRVGSVP